MFIMGREQFEKSVGLIFFKLNENLQYNVTLTLHFSSGSHYEIVTTGKTTYIQIKFYNRLNVILIKNVDYLFLSVIVDLKHQK